MTEQAHYACLLWFSLSFWGSFFVVLLVVLTNTLLKMVTTKTITTVFVWLLEKNTNSKKNLDFGTYRSLFMIHSLLFKNKLFFFQKDACMIRFNCRIIFLNHFCFALESEDESESFDAMLRVTEFSILTELEFFFKMGLPLGLSKVKITLSALQEKPVQELRFTSNSKWGQPYIFKKSKLIYF